MEKKQLTQEEWQAEQLTRAKAMQFKFVIGCGHAYTRHWNELAESHQKGWLAIAADAMKSEGYTVVEPVKMTDGEQFAIEWVNSETLQRDSQRSKLLSNNDMSPAMCHLARLIDARDAERDAAKAKAVVERLKQFNLNTGVHTNDLIHDITTIITRNQSK